MEEGDRLLMFAGVGGTKVQPRLECVYREHWTEEANWNYLINI